MRDGWSEVQLGDLLARRTERLGDAEEPRILTVTEGHGLVDQMQHWGRRVATADLSSYKVVDPNDVVYNVYLLWSGAIGQNLFAERGVTSPVYEVFTPSRNVAPRFLGLILESLELREAFDTISIGTIPRRRRAPWRDFLGLGVRVPPLDEQRRIVDVAGALDDTITALEGCARSGLYAGLLREINRRYQAVPLGTVLDSAFAGGTPSRKRADFFGGEIPWLKSGEVENDRIETTSESITVDGLVHSSAKMVPSGSTVVAMYGQGDTKGRAGYVASPVATNQAVLSLQPNLGRITSRYLLHAVRSRTESLRSRAVGAAQPNLSKGLVLSERIPLPPLAEQAELAELMDSLLQVDISTRDGLQALRALRSNVLTALLSGEHEIPKSYDALMEGVA